MQHGDKAQRFEIGAAMSIRERHAGKPGRVSVRICRLLQEVDGHVAGVSTPTLEPAAEPDPAADSPREHGDSRPNVKPA